MPVQNQTPRVAPDEKTSVETYRALGWRQRRQAERAVYRGETGLTTEECALLYGMARRRMRRAVWAGLLTSVFIGLAWGLRERAGLGDGGRLATAVLMAAVWAGLWIVKPQVTLRRTVERNADALRIPRETWSDGLPGPLLIAVACIAVGALTWVGVTMLPTYDLF